MSGVQAPPGFVHWAGDPAEDRIGPFFYRVHGDGVETCLAVQPHHCNTYGIVHGGVLMAFADYTLCIAAMETPDEAVVTVSATCDFVDSARAGALLSGHGTLVRRTGSLAFVRAELRDGERAVMSASGVIKRLRAKA